MAWTTTYGGDYLTEQSLANLAFLYGGIRRKPLSAAASEERSGRPGGIALARPADRPGHGTPGTRPRVAPSGSEAAPAW